MLNVADVLRKVCTVNDLLATKLVHGNPSLRFITFQFDVAVQMQTKDIFLLLKESALNTLMITCSTE